MPIAEYIRVLALAIGTGSSWTALAIQFRNFYTQYGTLLHVSTSVATNPLLTPCLYGSLAFLGAYVWAVLLFARPSVRSDVWLNRLLLFGVVFAAVVVTYDCGEYLHLFRIGVPVTCSPNVNPIFTACFRGLVFFIIAYAAGVWHVRSRRVSESISS